MSKKFFFLLLAAAGTMLAASCSNEKMDDIQISDEAVVTFSVGTEGGIATRAVSDGKTADKLVWAVYNEDGQLLNVFKNGDAYVGQEIHLQVPDMTENTKTVTVNLAKGQKYNVLFWAQNSACGAYSTDDLRNVTVSYDGFNNDENRDAFFACQQIEVRGNETFKVTLKRPFAQINVGVTAADWDAAVASGINIKQSEAVIKQAATKIDLLDGHVSEPVNVTYRMADIISDQTLDVDLNADQKIADDEKFRYLSMSYILVNDAKDGASKANLSILQFTFKPENGNEILFTEGVANVPVQRNWRTNIVGQILTGTIDFEVMIDKEYLGDYNIDYPDGIDVEYVDLTQDSDISGNEDPFVEVTDPTMFDGNGNKFTAGSASDYSFITRGTYLEINDTDVVSHGGGIAAADGGTVVFNGNSVYVDTPSTSGRYIFYAEGEGSTITINGGSFSWDPADNQKRAYIYAGAGTTVYVNGGTFGKASTRSGYTAGILGSGTVIITGGTFGFDPSNWVASGYEAVKNGTTWTVSKL